MRECNSVEFVFPVFSFTSNFKLDFTIASLGVLASGSFTCSRY
jgi:hypothetical protein